MATATSTGRITQVIGSTFDVEFPEDAIPSIYNAVKIDSDNKGVDLHLTGEVQQHLGGGKVRCVALGSTDGLVRGQEVVDTGGGSRWIGHRSCVSTGPRLSIGSPSRLNTRPSVA